MTKTQTVKDKQFTKRNMFENFDNIIAFALDKNYCYLDFSILHKKTIKEIWGVDIEIGSNILGIIGNENDRKKAKINFDKALAGESFILTEEYGDESLKSTYYEDRYNPILDEDKNIIGVSVFVIDITKYKKTQKALEASEKRYRLLVENAPDEIFTITPEGILTYISPNTMGFGRFNPEKEIGEHISKFIANPSQLQLILKILERVNQNRETAKVEFQHIVKDGEPFWGEVTGKPIIENNKLVGIHCIMRNVSERKKIEKALEESTQKLKKLNASKDKFFSIIAHDLRSPFNSMMGISRLLHENFDTFNTKKQKEYIGAIYKVIKNTYKLLDNLLI